MDFHQQDHKDHEEEDKVREINTPTNYNYLHSSSSSCGHSRHNTVNFNTSHELQFIDLPLKSNNEEVLDGHIVDNNNQCNWYNTEKEHMFDKVVTPSDVGKLNRLVIPKQFAEKYLPLNSSTNDKALILNFEDRSGKKWRFKYSYWNSSQSYVITKGWNRFVKDKKLNAGDIVSFQRCVGGKDHLYIDWRCRHLVHKPITTSLRRPLQFHNIIPSLVHEAVVPLQYLNLKPQVCSNYYNNQNQQQYGNNQLIRSSHEDDKRGGNLPFMVESVNSFRSSSKRMRLFGVNMEYCPTEEESDVSTASSLSLVPSEFSRNKGKSTSLHFNFDS